LFAGWTTQPGTIVPPRITATLPSDFNKAYINIGTPQTPTPWTGFVRQTSSANPVVAGQSSLYGLFADSQGAATPSTVFSITDVATSETYFNTQALVTLSGGVYRSNLQSEYR
jgi:hypothetical protein